MTDKNKTSVFILQFIKLTQKGEIKWERRNPPRTPASVDEPIVDFVYTTRYKVRYFKIFKYKYKSFIDEEDFHWSERIRFDLTDSDFNSLYEFPYEYSLYDLYNAVREANSGINQILEDFLDVE